jgi:mannose/fructose/N-acetylgalactosamine-specific phosphotransferase system component IIB
VSIVLVRVDSRLIHGQIIEAWIPYTKAQALIVVDDEVEGNLIKRSVMEMAVPSSVEVSFDTKDEAVREYLNGGLANKRIIVLFSNVQDAKSVYDHGFRFDTLNLGNMHFCEGKVQVCPHLCMGRQDTDIIEDFSRMGVAIDTRSVPREKKIDLKKIIKKAKGK